MKTILAILTVITFAGCGSGLDAVAGPVRTTLQVAKDRGLIAMAFGKYAKLSAFTRKLTNDGKPAPPIDKKPREEGAAQTEQEKYGPHPNGPEGDYGPTQYRLDISIAGWRPEKDSELAEVRKFVKKNNLTLSVQGVSEGPRRIDCDVGVRIFEDRQTLLIEQKYGWGYWREPLKEDLLPNAATDVHDSVGWKSPFEIIFAPLTAERLQKLWDERKPRTKDHPEGYVARFNGSEKQSSLATVASEKPKTPEKPVVFVYLTDDFPPERKTICPPCIRWSAWWDQLSPAQRDSLPLRFERVKQVPDCAKDWARPAFHWTRDSEGCKTEGWTDWATFESIWKQPPAEPVEVVEEPKEVYQPSGCGPNGCGRHGRRRAAIVPRPVAAPTVQAAVHSISKDYVNQLLAVFGKGEVRLTDQASMIIPSNVGVTITRTGDQVAAVLSEPFPVVRYRTWGLRFDDTLRGATVDPQQAAIHLGRYGTVKFAVE